MNGEQNVLQVILEDVCVCLCVRACVCACVEHVNFIGLGGMERPGDYITLEVSGNVCTHLRVSESPCIYM